MDEERCAKELYVHRRKEKLLLSNKSMNQNVYICNELKCRSDNDTKNHMLIENILHTIHLQLQVIVLIQLLEIPHPLTSGGCIDQLSLEYLVQLQVIVECHTCTCSYNVFNMQT